MITSTAVYSLSISDPKEIYRATTTGAAGGSNQDRAITSMILVNTGAPTLSDETINSVNVNIHLVKSGQTAKQANLIVSNLIIPAGETVFFSDERIVLDGGDSVYISSSGATETAGAFTIGANYTISNLGSTTNTQWNTIAGTSAVTYIVGSSFTCANVGTGLGNGQAIRNLITSTVSTLPV